MHNLNQDPQEIQKFSQLASRWWEPEGEFKTLHEINPLRLGFIEDQIAVKNKKILDIGCGGGILSESLAELEAEVTGLDASPEIIQIAQAHAEQRNLPINYLAADLQSITPKFPAYFDIITCLELLEHVPDPREILRNASLLVKPGGDLFFSTINRNPKAYLYAILGAEYLLHLLPKGTHDYAKFIRPSELAAWGRENNLILQKMIGLTYNPLTKKYRLTDDISVNYMAHFKHAT